MTFDKITLAIHQAAHKSFEFAVLAKDMQTPVEKSAAVSTQIGAAMAVYGGFTLNEWAAIVGIIVALGSFCLNFYVSLRRLRIDEESARRKKKP